MADCFYIMTVPIFCWKISSISWKTNKGQNRAMLNKSNLCLCDIHNCLPHIPVLAMLWFRLLVDIFFQYTGSCNLSTLQLAAQSVLCILVNRYEESQETQIVVAYRPAWTLYA